MAPTCPPRGVYAPVVAFFHEDETLDLESLKTHITRLAEGGVAGLVIQGSNGEAPHLLHSERKEIISTASAVLRDKGRPGSVILAGCGAQSTRETVQLCQEAQESGADYALVLSPSYWGKSSPFFIYRELLTNRLLSMCTRVSSRSNATAYNPEVLYRRSNCVSYPNPSLQLPRRDGWN